MVSVMPGFLQVLQARMAWQGGGDPEAAFHFVVKISCRADHRVGELHLRTVHVEIGSFTVLPI